MVVVFRFLGAVVVTYMVSRAMLILLGGISAPKIRTVIAHLASLILICLCVGLLRAYWTSFDWRGTIIYVAPQILWFLLDYARAPRR